MTFITCFLSIACYFSHPTTNPAGCIVYVGVKFVNKFATVALLCVIFSIIAVYTGIFVNIHGNDNLKWVWWYFHRCWGVRSALLWKAFICISLVASCQAYKYLTKSSSFTAVNFASAPISVSLFHSSMCVLGRRLLKDIQIDNCTKEVDGTLWQEFCILKNNSNDRDYVRNPEAFRSKMKNWQCDSYFEGLHD